MWTTGFYFEGLDRTCDRNGEPTLQLLKNLATRHNVNIVGGTVADMQQGNIYNRAFMIDRKAQLIATYDKIHLFSMAGEGKYITPGSQLCSFDLDGIKCGIITCYDLRFPELARSLALEGIKLLFVPAQWPAARLIHWETLLKARAIENQVFVAASNRAGDGVQSEYAGGSMLLDPWGTAIAKGKDGVAIITGFINLQTIDEIKSKMNVYQDRVPELYKVK